MFQRGWLGMGILFSFTILFAPIALGAPPAAWDIDYVTDDLLASDWEYVAYGDGGWIGDGTQFCTGIVKYTTEAFDPDEGEVVPGEAWGYYATKSDDGLTIDDCEDLVGYFQENASRPGVLFMHGNRDRGSLMWAMWIAYSFTRADAGPSGHPFVLSISAPGQGYDCMNMEIDPPVPGEDANLPECQMYPDEDQFSVGQGMNDGPDCWHEGFYGYESQIDPDPENHILWGYTTSAMRAINLFKQVFDNNSTYDLGFTNGHLVVGGFSAGGMTSLLTHTQDLGDNDPDGFFALSSSGAFDNIVAQKGSALAYLLTMESYADEFDPEFSIDCPDVRLFPGNYSTPIERACQAIEYFEDRKSVV